MEINYSILAKRQTCSNKMNERAALEMFEKMQGRRRIHSHCVYTDFRMESRACGGGGAGGFQPPTFLEILKS